MGVRVAAPRFNLRIVLLADKHTSAFDAEIERTDFGIDPDLFTAISANRSFLNRFDLHGDARFVQ